MNQPWDGVADSEDAATLACNTEHTECMKDPKVAKTEACTTKKEECLKKKGNENSRKYEKWNEIVQQNKVE